MPDEALLVTNSPAIALSEGFSLTPTGLIVTGEPTLEQFGEAIARCGRVANATAWAIGDLIVYAEGRGDYGVHRRYVPKLSPNCSGGVGVTRLSTGGLSTICGTSQLDASPGRDESGSR